LKLYLGVKFYEHLAGRYSLGPSQYHDKEETLLNNPCLSPNQLLGSVSYLDVQMDDVALSNWLLNKARSMGVEVVPDSHVESITLDGRVLFSDGSEKRYSKVINACGPWAAKLFADSKIQSDVQLTLVRGSHLLVNRVIENPIVFQVPEDERIVFILPQGDKVLIGTTEVVHSLGEKITTSQAEIEYLLNAVNGKLRDSIKLADIIGTYSGIRPIVCSRHKISNVSAANRESSLESIGKVVGIFGGKWTSAVRLGRSVADLVMSK
jgi:glycerol-3-phosphate dehydrogenase